MTEQIRLGDFIAALTKHVNEFIEEWNGDSSMTYVEWLCECFDLEVESLATEEEPLCQVQHSLEDQGQEKLSAESHLPNPYSLEK